MLRRRQPEGPRERRPPLAGEELRDRLAASEGRHVLLREGGCRRHRVGGLRLPRHPGVQASLPRQFKRPGDVAVEGPQRRFRHARLLQADKGQTRRRRAAWHVRSLLRRVRGRTRHGVALVPAQEVLQGPSRVLDAGGRQTLGGTALQLLRDQPRVRGGVFAER